MENDQTTTDVDLQWPSLGFSKLRLTLSMAYLDLAHVWIRKVSKKKVKGLTKKACLPSMIVAHSQVEDSKPQLRGA